MDARSDTKIPVLAVHVENLASWSSTAQCSIGWMVDATRRHDWNKPEQRLAQIATTLVSLYTAKLSIIAEFSICCQAEEWSAGLLKPLVRGA